MDTSRIDNILNTWLEQNGFDCTVEIGTDFAYYYDQSIITYALVVPSRMEALFMDFAKRRGLQVDCGDFLMSFFHELGHHETLDLIDDGQYVEAQETKKKLTDSNEDTEIYFNLIDEITATDWAISYINNNLHKICRLGNDLRVAVEDFYIMKQISITESEV